PPPSRYTRFGLSAKMPRAPPKVHFSWPGSVLRSFGHPSTTSYGPEMSSAQMASATALADVRVVAVSASALGGIRRPPSEMPTARPATRDNTTINVLLIALLR